MNYSDVSTSMILNDAEIQKRLLGDFFRDFKQHQNYRRKTGTTCVSNFQVKT